MPCPHCAAPFDAEAEACPRCGRSPTSDGPEPVRDEREGAELPTPSAPSGESRAEPPAPRRTALIVGGIGLAALAGAFVLELGATKSSNVPSGIAGAKLGDDAETLRRSVPGLTDAPARSDALASEEGKGETYPRLRARAPVFDEPATCTYELAVNERVSRIECAIDPSEDPAHARTKEAKVLTTLRELYGAESEQSGDSYKWQNDRARLLMLRAPADPSGRAVIRVANWSADHERVLGEIASARDARELREREERNRRELERRRQEVERLERGPAGDR